MAERQAEQEGITVNAWVVRCIEALGEKREWFRLSVIGTPDGLFAVTSLDDPGLLCIDRDPVEALKMVPGALRDLKKAREET